MRWNCSLLKKKKKKKSFGTCENYSRRAPINRKAVWLLSQLECKEYIKVEVAGGMSWEGSRFVPVLNFKT